MVSENEVLAEPEKITTMSINTLPHLQELTNLLREWGDSSVEAIQTQDNKGDLLQNLSKLSNLIADITSKVSANPSAFSKEELNQLSNLACDQLEITSCSLVEVHEKLSWIDPMANNSYKNLSLFKQTLIHLERVTENLIRVVTQAEIDQFQSQQELAYYKVSSEQINEARHKLVPN